MLLSFLHARSEMAPQALAQTRQATAEDNRTAGVEVTARPLPPSRFCAFGPRAYVVYLPMEVTVANGRRTPIILARSLNIQRILLGKKQDDMLAGKYELATDPRPLRSSGATVNFGAQPSDDAFVVLKHNQAYTFTAIQGIPVRNDASENISGTIYPGDLFLSIELQTWPYSRDAGPLQKQWTRSGELISAPVVSYPTIVKLPASPATEDCKLTGPASTQ